MYFCWSNILCDNLLWVHRETKISPEILHNQLIDDIDWYYIIMYACVFVYKCSIFAPLLSFFWVFVFCYVVSSTRRGCFMSYFHLFASSIENYFWEVIQYDSVSLSIVFCLFIMSLYYSLQIAFLSSSYTWLLSSQIGMHLVLFLVEVSSQ